METSTHPESAIDIFHHPARIIIAGYSNSGKSEICSKLIQKYHTKFNTILYCGVTSHTLEKNGEINSKFKVSNEILNPFDYIYNGPVLYILDDCFLEAVQSKHVVDAFTKGRHEKISTIFITQNMFFNGKYSRNISLNCSHYILMRSRDLGQIETLGRQLFGKKMGNSFVDIYKRAITSNSYGYLLVDFAPDTPPELQLRTNIVDETPYQKVYQF